MVIAICRSGGCNYNSANIVFLASIKDLSRAGYIHLVGVHRRARGRGVGRALYEHFAGCAPGAERSAVVEAADIVYAYLDGETFNLINDRVVPGENLPERMVGNGVRLFEVLTEGK